MACTEPAYEFTSGRSSVLGRLFTGERGSSFSYLFFSVFKGGLGQVEYKMTCTSLDPAALQAVRKYIRMK